jgi:chemotaxis family two-component system response regulator Rcp1
MELGSMECKPVTILLVEDDPGDQKLIKKSLKDQRIANDLYVADSAEEALDFLHRRGSYSHGTPRPDLILLDLNMPGMGGKEFLKEVKNDNYLKVIPVNVLTTSDAERDILDSYRLHANGYLKKPVDLPELKEVIKKIGEYWFVICKRPPKEPSH